MSPTHNDDDFLWRLFLLAVGCICWFLLQFSHEVPLYDATTYMHTHTHKCSHEWQEFDMIFAFLNFSLLCCIESAYGLQKCKYVTVTSINRLITLYNSRKPPSLKMESSSQFQWCGWFLKTDCFLFYLF